MNCTVCEVVNKVHFKKNVEPRLVSSFSNYVGGGPMPLAGAPHDVCMQLLACLQFFTKCLRYSLVACLPFLCCVFPNPPFSLFLGLNLQPPARQTGAYPIELTGRWLGNNTGMSLRFQVAGKIQQVGRESNS